MAAKSKPTKLKKIKTATSDPLTRRIYHAAFSHRSSITVGVILGFAFFLRITNLQSVQPQFDEGIVRAVVDNIWHGDLTNNWSHAAMPSPQFKVDCYNFSSYIYADAGFVYLLRWIFTILTLTFHHTVYWDRLLSVILSTVGVYLFYKVALYVYGQQVAILSSLIVSILPLMVQDAHYARPEAFLCCLVGCAYLASLKMLERCSLKWLFLSSVLYGVAVACKVSMLPMCLLPLACLARTKRLAVIPVSLWLFATIIGCFLGVPDAFFHPTAYWHGVEFLQTHYSSAAPPNAMLDSTRIMPLMAAYFLQTFGLGLCGFGLVGMAPLRRAWQFNRLVFLAAPICMYVVYFGTLRIFFERNLSHVVPLIAICAAAGVVEASRLPGIRRLPPVIIIAFLTSVILYVPIKTTFLLVFQAMPTSTEARGAAYEAALTGRLGLPVSHHTHLLTDEVVRNFSSEAARSATPLLLRILDYHDQFTEHNVAELLRCCGGKQVGYFPSLFEGSNVNTIVIYHSPSLRYVVLPSQLQPSERSRFVSWDVAAERLEPQHVELGTWVLDGYYHDVYRPPRQDVVFGSFNSLGDRNRGAISLGPFDTAGIAQIGIPVVTGPVSTDLSLMIYDHRSRQVIDEVRGFPVCRSWVLFKVDLSHNRPAQIDIVAKDESSEWGQWMAIGLPFRLNATQR